MVALTAQLQQRLADLPPDESTAWLFPGQGSQAVGMGREAHAASPAARTVFEAAESTLGYPLAGLCFEGPEEELRDTANAQPALFVVSLAYLAAALEAKALSARPAFAAGHSLGQYTALVAAGAIDFSEALALVQERGRLMKAAGQAQPGAMAAVLGLPEAAVREICQRSGAELANLNCPGQVVVGGPPQAVERATALARQAGAKTALLNVSGAFHTSLMASAAQALARAIDGASIRDPLIPVVANSSAQPLSTAPGVRDELKRQLLSPVLWQQSVECMLASGVRHFLEIGPGRVLAGLLKRIDGDARSLGISELLTPLSSHVGPER